MLSITRIANHCWLHRPLFTLSNRPSITKLKLSTFSSVEVSCSSDEECDNFLPWLERKAGMKISSVLSIGKSAYGRSLLASKSIEPGDCMLKVPYNCGMHSEWAPFMSRLPQHGELHNTINCYVALLVLGYCVDYDFLTYFDGFTMDISVESRAWRSTRGVSLIPFADFLNHDGAAEEVVLSDEDKKLSEVIADRNYSPGDQVLIRYGKFSNATLLLDFGFTLSYNIYDEVSLRFGFRSIYLVMILSVQKSWNSYMYIVHQPLKMSTASALLRIPSQSSWEVRSAKGKGRGIPQSLRAFARVLCSTSSQELSDLAMEAVQNDGRLARYPLKNKTREMEAHWFLLSKITRLVEEHNVSIKSLEPSSSPFMFQKFALRKQMARDLLAGELRVLKSASEWLKNYCTTLSKL
ncbi:hypothetical protein HYC85_000694 [Camellia sinensis]|uniref:SET domain-containing protein n=1 Tax=Camellia sinensis TaxID=4442 RepID=A0A7J7I3Z2_CAMSI|nr:hypothetical protein HYC85_000694 [Camellia sinensis]